MAQAFMRQSRKTPMDPPRSLPARSWIAVRQSPRAATGRAWVAPEGSFDRWGRGRFRQSRIDEPGQTLTSVRLTCGDGAPGLLGRDRPYALILKAIARRPPNERVEHPMMSGR
jgi:hypothetical protein